LLLLLLVLVLLLLLLLLLLLVLLRSLGLGVMLLGSRSRCMGCHVGHVVRMWGIWIWTMDAGGVHAAGRRRRGLTEVSSKLGSGRRGRGLLAWLLLLLLLLLNIRDLLNRRGWWREMLV